MPKKNTWNNFFDSSPFLLYALAWLLLIKYFRYSLGDGDIVYYASIAERYARGDFYGAINAYWSPLTSWLIIPFLFFKISPLLAAKFVSFVIGLVTMAGIKSLSRVLGTTRRMENVLVFSAIPILLHHVFSGDVPDSLSTCVLLFYLSIIFHSDYPKRFFSGLWCGFLGILASLAKAYIFPFFVAHFLLLNIFHYRAHKEKVERSKILKHLFFGLFVFFAVACAWRSVLSVKYHENFIFTTTGKINHAWVGPQGGGNPKWAKRGGFVKLADATAHSCAEDASCFRPKSWSPLQSSAAFSHQVRIAFCNAVDAGMVVTRYSIFSMSIIFVFFFLCFSPFSAGRAKDVFFYPLLTILLYVSGYLLIFIEERHLRTVDILLFVMGGRLLAFVFQNFEIKPAVARLAMAAMSISFMVAPVQWLWIHHDADKSLYDLSQALKTSRVQGNLVANGPMFGWQNQKMAALAYYLNSRYLGTPSQNSPEKETLDKLTELDADYFLVWDKPGSDCSFLSRYREVFKAQQPELRVYSLKEKIL